MTTSYSKERPRPPTVQAESDLAGKDYKALARLRVTADRQILGRHQDQVNHRNG